MLILKALTKLRFILIPILIYSLAIVSTATGLEKKQKLSSETIALIKKFYCEKDHPASGAIILLKENEIEINNNGVISETVHILGKLCTKDAIEQYNQIGIFFNSFYDEIDLIFAHTINLEGEIISVSKDAFQLKSAPQEHSVKKYSDVMQLTFTLPALKKESFFEYKLSIKKKPVINTEWFYDHKFHNVSYNPSSGTSRIDPVYISKLNLRLPDKQKIFFSSKEFIPAPDIKKEKSSFVYSWTQKDLPPLIYEERMPSINDLIPMIQMSSIKKWSKIDTWAHNLFSQKIIVSKKIREKSHNLIQGVESEQDRVMRIAQFINTNIGYVSARRNRDIYYPHSSVETFLNQYGNCQDQVVLFISMLKSIGIEAFPVFITPFPYERTNTETPIINFAHVITYVPLHKNPLWVDTSSDSFDFPNLHWANQNRKSFIINGKGGKIITTPFSKPEDNKNTITRTYKFNNNDFLLEMHIRIEGATEGSYKAYLKQLSLEQQKKFFLEITGKESEPKNFSILNLDDPLAPFIAILKFEAKNAFYQYPESWRYKNSYLPFDLFFPEIKSILQNNTRHHDYISNYKQQLIQDSICFPPNKLFRMLVLPENETIENEFIHFNKNFSREDDSIRVKTEFSLKKTHIKKQDFGKFYHTIEDVLNKWDWEIIFTNQHADNKLLSLIMQFEHNPDDLDTLLNLCRLYMAEGKYNEAMRLLQKGAKMAPESGEIKYLTGLALGYLDRFEESKISFKKARELGYRP